MTDAPDDIDDIDDAIGNLKPEQPAAPPTKKGKGQPKGQPTAKR